MDLEGSETFSEYGHVEIISTVILFLPPNQEGLSVTSKVCAQSTG